MNIDRPHIKETLFLEMERDLQQIAPNLIGSGKLICCICGRLLPRRHFTLEHIVPQQLVKSDPAQVRHISKNKRSGLTLLCNYSLGGAGTVKSQNGCNGWKGRFFDRKTREILLERSWGGMDMSHVIALFSTMYLALFSRYGYSVVFTAAGIASRRQFFSPNRFNQDIPDRSQILMAAGAPKEITEATMPFWATPFWFSPDNDDLKCTVGIRHVSMALPISRPLNVPIRSVLPFAPSRLLLRPDFRLLWQ